MREHSAVASRWGVGRCVVAAASSMLLLAGVGFFAERAAALVPVVDDNPGMLTILAESSVLPVPQLLPGEVGYVQIGAILDGPDTGSLELELIKSGDLMSATSGLSITVTRCDVEWVGVSAVPSAVVPTCAAGEVEVVVATPHDDYSVASPSWDLDGVTSLSGKYLLLAFEFAPPALAPADPGWSYSGSYGVRLTAAGESVVTTDAAPPSLILTGADALPLALAALGLVGLGLAFSGIGRRRAEA